MSETTDFEEIEKQMSNKQRAVLHLLIDLHNEESQVREDGNKVYIQLDGGLSTSEVLQMVKNGHFSDLPVPETESFKYLGWSVIGKRMWKEEEEEYTVAGSPDARIIDDQENGALKIFANQGSFKGMEVDLSRVLNKNSHPFIVEDRKNFRFENDAFKAKQIQ